MNNFHYVSVLLDLLYSIEIDDEDMEEMGLLAWNKIGNKNIKLYRYTTNINPVDNSVTLPCNAQENSGENTVEAVTMTGEDWESVTNYSTHGNIDSSFIENAIEADKRYQSPYYLPGKYLKFEQVGDKLYFVRNYGQVNILYRGILADEDGLPELTDKEANAIATFIAYTLKFKEGLVTNNKDIMQQAIYLEQLWNKQCDQARITYLNQNDMNQLVQITNNWDRPRYSKSFKPIR